MTSIGSVDSIRLTTIDKSLADAVLVAVLKVTMIRVLVVVLIRLVDNVLLDMLLPLLKEVQAFS